MAVGTTDTSVRFTVTSNDYFDGPGSWIEFTILERDQGFYLQQEASAHDVSIHVAAGIGAGLVEFPWTVQAANLRQAVLKHG